MNITYAEAEGIKIGMPAEVQSALEPLLAGLARELRASIDSSSINRTSASAGSMSPAVPRARNSSSKDWPPS